MASLSAVIREDYCTIQGPIIQHPQPADRTLAERIRILEKRINIRQRTPALRDDAIIHDLQTNLEALKKIRIVVWDESSLEAQRQIALTKYLKSSREVAADREYYKTLKNPSKADDARAEALLDRHMEKQNDLYGLYQGRDAELTRILERIVLGE